jgi:polar amino acid transport system substrate-binding protein
MFNKIVIRILGAGLILLLVVIVGGCGEKKSVTDLSQLEGEIFAVPAGTVADQLVLSKFPTAQFKYYDTVLDACLAVESGAADAAAYDEPILRNIAAEQSGLMVLPDMITIDDYGFAVPLGQQELKTAIDGVVTQLKNNGTYDEMLNRWLPEEGAPAAMPDIKLTGNKGVLRFGTAAVTEPFSFLDENQKVVGLDIELAMRIAQALDMRLEVVNMDFGAMIPALIAGDVDMIGACITITDERAKVVMFSAPYYTGGIAALVKK